ncbi:MAG: AmmeMemoRadiSam system protein A [Eubacteriales bacterium]|nr:AmmeMemoRadiSam system protein A [Eubacteriales bacterium]
MSIDLAYIVPHPPVVIPEVGKGQEREIQKTYDAYHQIGKEIGEYKPETIILVTPHSITYQDYLHISPGKSAGGDFHKFGEYSYSIKVDYDQEFVSEIEKLAGQKEILAGTLGERDKSLDHGTLVPLYFIDPCLENYKVVRASISGLSYTDHYRFGTCIQRTAEKLGRRTVLIASGDLSHRLKEEGPYSYAKEGPIFDEQVVEAMKTADFLSFLRFNEDFCSAAGECGLRSFIVMAGALDGKAVKAGFRSYEGPFGVGYALCSYQVLGEDKNRRFDIIHKEEQKKRIKIIKEGEDPYVKLARLSLETYIRERRYIKTNQEFPEELAKIKAGVFVTLKKDDRLRGCIGTISPSEDNIGQEIIRNAVSAGTGDPRFDPVTQDELADIIYSVDVLGEPEPIQSASQLDPERYGVIVTMGRKRGLLLPNLEGVTTPEQQIGIALKKAGIGPRESYGLERFEVVRHK